MSDRGDGPSAAAGGPVRHSPVLREEALAALAPRAGGVYLDGTFGAGGYTQALLDTAGARVVALDRDPDAVAAGRALVRQYDRLSLHHARFGNLGAVLDELGLQTIDGVVLDIGVSSMQLDEAERGFSFRADGPLDMRMSQDGPSAADLVNALEVDALADVLFHYGEERASRRIARAIAHDRLAQPFTSTRQLAEMISRVMPGKSGDIHPATRSFQALRIAVNDELGELTGAMVAAEARLAPGGRLAVVTFHSLEDRIVKRFLQARSGRAERGSRHLPGAASRSAPTFEIEGKQPIAPGAAETSRNPRARSAKLRFAIRTDAPAQGADLSLRALAELPQRAGSTTRKGR